jgi:hypothetical protein
MGALEIEVQIAARRGDDSRDAGNRADRPGQLLRNRAWRLAERPGELEGDGNRQIAERPVRRHLDGERWRLGHTKVLADGADNRIVDAMVDGEDHGEIRSSRRLSGLPVNT